MVDETGAITNKVSLIYLAKERCQEDLLSAAYPNDGGAYCESVWDGWGCWNYTLAGKRAYISCPSYIEGFDPRLKAYRDCTSNGTWWRSPQNRTWSNYTPCINVAELSQNKRILFVYIAGYSISMTALFLSMIVFIVYRRQLQCDRVTLHKHLFVSYMLNGLSWILYYTLAAMDPDVIATNPIWCTALHVVTQYFIACNYMWMFCEGVYLHTIILQAFTIGSRLLIACCLIGWGVPVITTFMYTAMRAYVSSDTSDCWLKESPMQWIVSGPIIATLTANLFFLCNIVRVLVTKLRAVNSPDTVQTKKAVRATLILIPLLGLQYILFPMKPPPGSPFDELYSFLVAGVTSLQGLFVAVMFCFLNGEVLSAIRRHCRCCRRLSLNTSRRSSAGLSHGCTMYSPTRQLSCYSHTTMSMTDYSVAQNGNGSGSAGGSCIYRSSSSGTDRTGFRRQRVLCSPKIEESTAHPLFNSNDNAGEVELKCSEEELAPVFDNS